MPDLGGRPEHEPNQQGRDGVKVMVAGGMSHDAIARALRIARNTLEKHYREELDTGADEMNGKVLNALGAMAASGQYPAATFFYLKTRMGFKETAQAVELTGKDGGPINIETSTAKAELLSRVTGQIISLEEAAGDQQPDGPGSV